MRREDGGAADERLGLVEREAAAGHRLGDALRAEERGVALVHVRAGDLEAERLDGAQAADAEQDLLAEAVELVSAVELAGDAAQLGRVLGDVGVEEDERDAADVDLPRGEAQRALGERDLEEQRLAVLLAQAARDGEAVHVVLRVALDLPAGGVDLLLEVALAVEQADADERDVEVGGALEVVAGEDAEAAGVDVDGLVQAELHREVGDHAAVRLGVDLPVLGGLHLLLELRLDRLHVGEERGVGGELLEALLPDAGEEADGVELELAEEGGGDAAEERGGVGVPAPPDVVGEAGEEGEVLGDLRRDGEGAEGRHGRGWVGNGRGV